MTSECGVWMEGGMKHGSNGRGIKPGQKIRGGEEEGLTKAVLC